jgi:hypothetical protein
MSEIIKKIKSYFDSFRKKDTSYKKEGINPVRDWDMMITITFFIVCLLAVFAFYFYVQVDSGNLFTTTKDSNTTTVTINQDLLSKTIENIDAKKSALDKEQSNKSHTLDPAL